MKKPQRLSDEELEGTVVLKSVKRAIAASARTAKKSVADTNARGAKGVSTHLSRLRSAKTEASKPTATEQPTEEKKRVRRLKIDRKLKMNKSQQRHYRDLLQKLREEFCARARFHQDDALLVKMDANGERAGTATHLADLGSDNFRRDIELNMLNDEHDVIHMIDIALKKLENSEYGICAECGCAIPPARLEAKPYALFCTACKEKHEKSEGSARHHR